MRPDRALLDQYVRTGDADVFAALARRYAGMVYGTAVRVTGDAHEAEDVAQECFLALARQAKAIHSSLPAWLHRQAVGRSVDAVRKASRRRGREVKAIRRSVEKEETTWAEIAPHLDKAVAELPEKLREPLVRHYLQGETQAEIAAQCGLSQPTIQRRIVRGVDALRRSLRRSGIIASASFLAMLLKEETAGAVPASLGATLNKIAISGIGSAAEAGSALSTGGASITGGILMGVKAKLVAGAIVASTLLVGGVVTHQVLGGGQQQQEKASPEDSAVHYFIKAGELLLRDDSVPGTRVAGGGRPYAGDVAAIERFVEAHAEALAVLREGLEQDTCRVPAAVAVREDAPEAPQNWLPFMRALANVLVDEGFLYELKGEPDRAASSCLDALRMGTLLRQGMMIGQLIGAAIIHVGQAHLDQVIANSRLAEDMLRKVIAACGSAEVGQDELSEMWAVEAAYAEAIAGVETRGLPWDSPHDPDLLLRHVPIVTSLLEQHTLDDLLQKSVMDAVTENELKEFSGPDGMAELIRRWIQNFGDKNVLLRETRIRAAIALYEQREGQLPDRLEELVPGILPSMPKDPYTDSPMCYARTETGWKVWSVGPDNVDNGGAVEPPVVNRPRWQGADYVFVSEVPTTEEMRRRQ